MPLVIIDGTMSPNIDNTALYHTILPPALPAAPQNTKKTKIIMALRKQLVSNYSNQLSAHIRQ